MAAAVMFVLAVLPGIPTIPFLALSSGTAALAWNARKHKHAKLAAEAKAAATPAKVAPGGKGMSMEDILAAARGKKAAGASPAATGEVQLPAPDSELTEQAEPAPATPVAAPFWPIVVPPRQAVLLGSHTTTPRDPLGALRVGLLPDDEQVHAPRGGSLCGPTVARH